MLLLVLMFAATGCNSPSISAVPTKPSDPTPVSEGLVIDATQRLGTISPLVYGTNYGPWMKIPPHLHLSVKAAGLTYLRFPGGNWGDENDLQLDQIDQFIQLADQIGAEPAISVRLRGGTPEAAAQLVEYANVIQDYNVHYWSIGNEPSLYPDYDAARFNVEWRDFAQAMRAVDPHILLVGPDIHQYTADPADNPHDESGRDWLREFLLANGDLVDVIAIHRYPFPASKTDPPATIDELRANSREWDAIIPRLRIVINETVGRDLPIAVTEINSHWNYTTGGETAPDSFYNAIWWGDVLGRLIRQQVDIVAHFALQTDTSNGGWGLLSEDTMRSTYYVYHLYQQFGQELVFAISDDPDLSVYAAQRDDNALTVIFVNLGPVKKTKALHLTGISPANPAEIWLFDAEHQAEKIGEQRIASGDKITLPAQSVSLYIFDLNSETKTEIEK